MTRVLEDASAKGIYVQNRTKRVGNWKSETKPESEWGIVEVEPIVSESMWNEVNRIIEEQRKAMTKPARRPKHIFAGKLRCKCGLAMHVLSSTPKYFCEKCRTRIPVVDLEAIFLEQLKHFFANPELVQYSWWSYRAGARANNKGWRIDYQSVSNALKNDIVACQQRPDAVHADHCPVWLELK